MFICIRSDFKEFLRKRFRRDADRTIRSLRLEANTNWAFTIFVPNVGMDADGRFLNEMSSALAYLGGPYSVVPSNRDARVHAHETGHIFFALDEYPDADPNGSYFDKSGYYSTQNLNAYDDHPDPNSRVDSIMAEFTLSRNAFANHTSSPTSLKTLGWRDSNGNGIFDVLDVPLELSGVGVFDADSNAYHFTGQSSAVALPNLNSQMRSNHNDITLNQVSRVQYRIDGGQWITAQEFHTTTASIDFSFSANPGSEIEIRTVDDATGITSNIFSDSTEVNQSPILTPIGNKQIAEGSELSFTASATDPDLPDNTLTFSLDAGFPAGATITAGGNFSWTPTEAQGPGTYMVTVRVTDDGIPAMEDSETITISVGEVNLPPVLAPIGDRSMATSQDTLEIELNGSDLDEDPLSYRADFVTEVNPLAQQAFDKDQELGLEANATFNWGGANEKWLRSTSGRWYFITPDGKFYEWIGASPGADFIPRSRLDATFDETYYNDPSKLYDAKEPTAGTSHTAGHTLTIDGNRLTIDPADGFIGDLTIKVTVSDGTETVEETFTLTVTEDAPNRPPVLAPIGDRSMPSSQDTLEIELNGSDLDEDPLSYTATFVDDVDPLAQKAFEKDQELGLEANATFNWGGANEKWLRSASGKWYFITPDGKFYEWTGAGPGAGFIPGSRLDDTFDETYYNDPSKLYDTKEPTAGTSDTANHSLTIDGNRLTIDPADGFMGDLTIKVTLSDGTETAEEMFTLTVTDGDAISDLDAGFTQDVDLLGF
jgi:hypothetical protein